MEIVNDRAVGVWGLLRIFQEMKTGGWYGADLYFDPSDNARQLRVRLESQIEQCLEECQKQCTDEEISRLAMIYMQRPEPVTRHAGFYFPTFIDFISCILIQVLDFLVVTEIAEDYLRSEIDRVQAIDIDFVWAGVANEMRLVALWRSGKQEDQQLPEDASTKTRAPTDEELAEARRIYSENPFTKGKDLANKLRKKFTVCGNGVAQAIVKVMRKEGLCRTQKRAPRKKSKPA